MKPEPRWDLVGAAAGGALGVLDFLFVRALGMTVNIRGEATPFTLASLLVSSSSLLGYVAGHLVRARARGREQERLAAIGRLAAGMAHEVRNPLGVIRASAALAQESFEPTDDGFRACQFICEETVRLNGLVTSLLALSKPTPLQKSRLSVADVVDRAVGLAQEEVRKKRARIDRALGVDEAFGDRDLLTQALSSLVANAAESAPEEGTIQIRSGEERSETWIEIADDGPGVPVASEREMFEPFFTTKARGTGLGLPMALRITEAHGGRLALVFGRGAGREGSGACFRLTLPRSRG